MADTTSLQPSVPFSPKREAWSRFRRHKMAMVSLFLLLFMIFVVLFGPFIWTVPINEINFSAQFQGPSWAHPLGTDDLGQDVLARMLYGGRISLAVGVAAMIVAVVVGIIVGAIAGVAPGLIDTFLMWVTDLFLSLPSLPILLLVIYMFRDSLKVVVTLTDLRLRGD